MKYTIHGLQQQGLIDLELTHTDALLLRFFLDFKSEGRMKEIIIENETFYWLNYKNIEEQLPIIKNDSVSISRKFRKYEELGLIKKVVKNTTKGKMAYLNITTFFTETLSEYTKKSHRDKKDHGENTGIGIKSHRDKKDHAHRDKKDHAIYNSSINDSSHHFFKKINKKESVFEKPLRKKRKQQPSKNKKSINQKTEIFIQKVIDIYPKTKPAYSGSFINKEGKERLAHLYQTKILKENFQTEEYFLENLKCFVKIKQDYTNKLSNYVGTKNSHKGEWIDDHIEESKKQASQKNNSGTRKNPQHHYCENGKSAEQIQTARAKAEKLWREQGIPTEGFVFLD